VLSASILLYSILGRLLLVAAFACVTILARHLTRDVCLPYLPTWDTKHHSCCRRCRYGMLASLIEAALESHELQESIWGKLRLCSGRCCHCWCIGLEMGLHALILAFIPLPVLVWGYLAPLFVGFRMIRALRTRSPASMVWSRKSGWHETSTLS